MKEALLRSPMPAGCTKKEGLGSSCTSHASCIEENNEQPEGSAWIAKGEYTLAALLAIVFVYTLAFSHTNHTPFATNRQRSKLWWKARSDVLGWMDQHQLYINEAVLASQSSALQLDFYGDGVVEAWRGTQHGQPTVRCQEGPAIFQAYLGSEYESHAWGVAGDATQHLMWRLRHGEGLASEGPQLAVIMIGSSDLTYASLKDDADLQAVANSTITRIHAMAQYLSDLRPQLQVLLAGLLPRGDLTLPPDQHLSQPSKFTPTIRSINQQLEQLAAVQEDMQFVDCGSHYSHEGVAGRIRASLMPDGVNLNAAGMEQLALCLQPVIRDMAQHMKSNSEDQTNHEH